MRKFVSAVAIAVGVAAGGLAPTAAQAASAAPAVLWASSVEEELGRIQVGVSADAGVASIKIHVISPATEQEVAVVDSFHLVNGTEQNGWWQADDAVILPELGAYRLDSEITDADGVHVEQRSVGFLAYMVKMFFKDLKVTRTVSYDKRKVTASGRLMGRWPGTGDVKPVENFPIEFVTWYGNPADGVSGKVGHFELTTEVQYADEAGYLTTLWDDSRRFYLQAYADTQAPEVRLADTRITADLDRDTVINGEQVTLTGELSWKTPQEWRPMPDAPVYVSYCDTRDYCTLLGATSTDGQGRYQVTVSPFWGGTLRVSTYNPDPFVTTVTHVDKQVVVLNRTQFTDFFGGRIADGQVWLHGHLQFLDNSTPGQMPVDIQFSKDGTAGWHTASSFDISYNPTNPEGYSFEAFLDEPGPGYWRATYAGSATSFQSAVSAVVFVD